MGTGGPWKEGVLLLIPSKELLIGKLPYPAAVFIGTLASLPFWAWLMRTELCTGGGPGTAGSIHQTAQRPTTRWPALELGGVCEWQAEDQVCISLRVSLSPAFNILLSNLSLQNLDMPNLLWFEIFYYLMYTKMWICKLNAFATSDYHKNSDNADFLLSPHAPSFLYTHCS